MTKINIYENLPIIGTNDEIFISIGPTWVKLTLDTGDTQVSAFLDKAEVVESPFGGIKFHSSLEILTENEPDKLQENINNTFKDGV
ncbi:MAG: hypothetical protein PHN88_16260 [Ignavibacteria bacterium]|nr:hypothetical protein [Ignavibacteria bacterium]